MSGFSLLFGKILESSLWIQESKETRILWITILAMKDKDGLVEASVVGLADRAKISLEDCRKSLKILMDPDPNDTSKVEEGRRLREVPGGWQVINNDLYRFSTEARRELWRQAQEAKRAKDAIAQSEKNRKYPKRGTPQTGEVQFDQMERNGEDTSLEPGRKIPLPERTIVGLTPDSGPG